MASVTSSRGVPGRKRDILPWRAQGVLPASPLAERGRAARAGAAAEATPRDGHVVGVAGG